MKTTYFWKAGHEPEPNTTYVRISQQPMTGIPMPYAPALIPNWDIIRAAHAAGYNEASYLQYRDAYFAQLDKLDPQKIYNELKDCTLVCFESSKDLATGDKFCHRRMVAGWIEETLGIVVSEETRYKEKHLIVPTIYRNTPYSDLR